MQTITFKKLNLERQTGSVSPKVTSIPVYSKTMRKALLL